MCFFISEVAPDGYATPPGRTTPPQERSPSPPLPPPPPPEQLEHTEQVKAESPPQINEEFKAMSLEKTSETNVKSPTTPVSPTPLRLYADKDIRALEKNPMHNDIMNAAEVFKGKVYPHAQKRQFLPIHDDDVTTTTADFNEA